jgi:hypothetical protein
LFGGYAYVTQTGNPITAGIELDGFHTGFSMHGITVNHTTTFSRDTIGGGFLGLDLNTDPNGYVGIEISHGAVPWWGDLFQTALLNGNSGDLSRQILGLLLLRFVSFGYHFLEDAARALGIAHVDIGLGQIELGRGFVPLRRVLAFAGRRCRFKNDVRGCRRGGTWLPLDLITGECCGAWRTNVKSRGGFIFAADAKINRIV